MTFGGGEFYSHLAERFGFDRSGFERFGFE